VFFRDTAHGLITWAVATVLVATAAAASVSAVVEGGGHAVGAASQGNANGAYGVDKLFRTTGSAAVSREGAGDARNEAAHIVANSWSTGNVSDADRRYLVELVAVRTGSSQADAQKRVDEFVANMKDAVIKAKADADAARKAAAAAAIYTALSMLVGAFIASVSAALGGRLRDEHYL
jgi:hypothetical protein